MGTILYMNTIIQKYAKNCPHSVILPALQPINILLLLLPALLGRLLIAYLPAYLL